MKRGAKIALLVGVILMFSVALVGGTNVLSLGGDDVRNDSQVADIDQDDGTGSTVTDTDTDSDTSTDTQTDSTRNSGTDTDSDGLNDTIEQDLGTDPTVADTDSDGLDDGAEVRVYGTDPTTADTDGDSLDDAVEVNDYGTNPTQPDSDFDGLDDPEELDRGTNPTAPDTDDDGLNDPSELDIGTDPTVADTDGDGIPDGPEVNQPDLFPDANPLATDIFVEVDVVEGTTAPEERLDQIEEHYANAPVSNLDGSSGINLRFVVDDRLEDQENFGRLTWLQYKDNHFDNDGRGYHYLLLVEDAGLGTSENPGAVARGGNGSMIVTERTSPAATGSTIMHELGHSVGLRPEDYDGIDSEQYSYDEYPSVMNYNSADDGYGYSDGTAGPNDFDDWGHIESNLYQPGTERIDTSGYAPPG